MLVKKSTKRSGFIIFCDASPYKTLLRPLVAFSYVLITLQECYESFMIINKLYTAVQNWKFSMIMS